MSMPYLIYSPVLIIIRFLVLSQAFKERAAAGLVGWKDQAQWQVIQDDYVRDYNKRRLDKVVGKEE